MQYVIYSIRKVIRFEGRTLSFSPQEFNKKKYITQEKETGTYSITINGLKALRFLYELSIESIR